MSLKYDKRKKYDLNLIPHLKQQNQCEQNIKIAHLKLSLHWQYLAQYRTRLRPRYCTVYTYLGCDIAQGGQGQYYSDCRVLLSPTVLLTNVANVNYPLRQFTLNRSRLVHFEAQKIYSMLKKALA